MLLYFNRNERRLSYMDDDKNRGLFFPLNGYKHILIDVRMLEMVIAISSFMYFCIQSTYIHQIPIMCQAPFLILGIKQ